jgi:hypothetical protein
MNRDEYFDPPRNRLLASLSRSDYQRLQSVRSSECYEVTTREYHRLLGPRDGHSNHPEPGGRDSAGRSHMFVPFH